MGVCLRLTGVRFGRLVALERVPNMRPTHWRCQCDCGNTVIVRRIGLRSGGTQSCGCLRREMTAKLKWKHGMGRQGNEAPEYTIWKGMKARCYNPRSVEFKYYGGRGITVCERWRDSFEAFYADMGPRPKGGRIRASYSLERIDRNGPYSPENCKWATRVEQSRNKSNNRWLTLNGETLTLTDWERRTGFDITGRLKHGWSVERALTEQPGDPINAYRRRHKVP